MAKASLSWGTLRFLLFFTFRQCIYTVDSRIAYPKGCSEKPQSYYDYDDYPCPPPSNLLRSRSDFQLLRRLGSGKFSDVFEAVDLKANHNDTTKVYDEALVAIKCLKPVSERKIKRELLVLSHVSSLQNLARLIGVCWNDDKVSEHDTNFMPAIILQHAGKNTQWLSHGAGTANTRKAKVGPHKVGDEKEGDESNYYLSEFEIKYFIFQLLFALDALHSQGIMHRDVKPRNVLINRGTKTIKADRKDMSNPQRVFDASKEINNSLSPTADLIRRASSSLIKKLKRGEAELQIEKEMSNSGSTQVDDRSLMLIDLGLADFYLPGQRYNVRVASRHYKAPELLLGYDKYHFSVDLWSVGCILAGLLLRREPLFRGKNNVDQIKKIVSVLGTEDLLAYCEKYDVQLSREMVDAIGHHWPKKSWPELCKGDDCPAPSPKAINLLDRLLVYDQDRRLTAAEAMKHPFFDEIRKEVSKYSSCQSATMAK